MNVSQILNRIFPRLSTGLYDSVWPLYVVCRIIGLFNFKMDLRESNKCRFIVDKMMIVRSILQYLVLSTIILYNYFGRYNIIEFDTYLNEFRYKVGFACYAFDQILASVKVYVGLVFTSQTVWLMNQINKIDEDLKLLGAEIDHRYLNKYRKNSLLPRACFSEKFGTGLFLELFSP